LLSAGHDDDLPDALRRRADGPRRSVTVRFDKRQAELIGRVLLGFIAADPPAVVARHGRDGFDMAARVGLRLLSVAASPRGKRSRLDVEEVARRVARGQPIKQTAVVLRVDPRTIERALRKRRKLLDSTVLGQLSE
jgi:hypothetical protein